MIGQPLGPYEVVSTLGEGGMGAVYRARDTRLKRDVAIKVLLPEVANDPERLARFQREAEVLATLNHPNIAHIYGLESREGREGREGQDGREGLVGPFLVLELVEGPTLADRIAAMNGRGLPLDEALPIAKQIADALEAAHEEGIIHRDLKPANIKVKDNGTVKVLDFGLAKASERPGMPGGPGKPGVSGESGRPGLHALTQSPTLTSPALMTGVGMLLGTAAYMSPEQAKGRPADKRADIWAFGCVLYEMLTGQRAFPGEDVTDTIVSVLSKDADFSAIPETVPARVTQTLKVCLRKDAKQRASDIRDVRLALEGAFEPPAPAANVATAPSSRGRSVWMAFAVTAIAALAIGAGSATWLTTKNTVVSEPRVFQVESGDGITAPKISPDGRAVAFIKNGRLSVRALDTGKTIDLQGTDGASNASNPFWSPDSRTIAFFARTAIAGRTETRLFAVPANGGTVRPVADSAFSTFGASWGPSGILFVRFGLGLWLVSDSAPPREFAKLDTKAGEQNLAFPFWLPDGRVLAILTRTDSAVRSLVMINGGSRSTLVELGDEAPAWPVLAGSHAVLFQRQGASTGIWKIDLAPDLSSAAGAPTPVLPDGSFPSVSIDGTLVALSGIEQGDRQLVWVDRTGRSPTPFGRPQPTFSSPSVSPDGSTVAVRSAPLGAGANLSNANAIWLHQRTTSQRLPLGTIGGLAPAWAPADGRIAFTGVTAERELGLFVTPSAGIGDPQLITKANIDTNSSPAWSADGQSLVYGAEGDLWVVTAETGATPRRLLAKARQPAVSPDGHYLAYMSTNTGREEVYITSFPNPSAVWPVSADGGRFPLWNHRGGELFFGSGPSVNDDGNSNRDMAVAKIDTGSSIKIGSPEILFDAFALGYRTNNTGFRGYAVSPDGQRILLQTTGLSGTPTITAIQNLDAWLAREH